MAFDPKALDPQDIRFALFRYHLLYDSRHKQAKVHYRTRGEEWGLLLVTHNQTDPSAPLVIAHGSRPLVRELMARALRPGKRYLFIVPSALKAVLKAQTHSAEYGATCLLYSCSTTTALPEQAAVVRFQGKNGCCGYRVLMGDLIVSEARINWQTDCFAEMGVYTKRDFRGRGFAKAALHHLTSEILALGLRPLYVVNRNNLASIAVCAAVGYRLSDVLEYETVAIFSGTAHRLREHKRQPHVI